MREGSSGGETTPTGASGGAVVPAGTLGSVALPGGSAHRSSGGSGQPNRSSSQTDLYQMAYEASQRALDDQQDELGRLRDRGVNFAAFIGAATAFLVGTGLNASHRDWVFYLIAICASVCSLAFLWALIVLLNPSTRKLWRARISARVLIDEWIDVDLPPTQAQFTKELALSYDKARENNEKLLQAVRTWYRVLILVGSAQVLLWVALVWVRG
jgi:hypothetical protein